ncbi:osm1, partial [Symbiodinium microadriaticum]
MLPGDVQSRSWSSSTLVAGLAAVAAQANPELGKLLGCDEVDPELQAMQDELAQLEADEMQSPSIQRPDGFQETQTIQDTPETATLVEKEAQASQPGVKAKVTTTPNIARNLSHAFAQATEDEQDVPRNTEQWKDFAKHRELAGMAAPPQGLEGPCAEPGAVRAMEQEEVEEEGVVEDQQPPPELVELSENAMYKRMYRVFKMREDGSYLVPEELVQEWKNKNTRPNVVKIFQRCGYSAVPCLETYFEFIGHAVLCPNRFLLCGFIPKEKFVRKVQKVTEQGDEVEVDEDWEFLTEEEMQDKGWSEERINGAKAHCQKNQAKGYIRKSLYDDDVLYWCNMKVKGKKRNFKKSFVRKVIEYDEAAEDNDNSLECDFDGSDAPGGSNDQQAKLPPAESIDPKLLSCFPDVEKASSPIMIYDKAVAAVDKRINKLVDVQEELGKRIMSDLVDKMLAKVASSVDKLREEDAELTRLYNSGIIDGYSTELLCEPVTGPVVQQWAEDYGDGAGHPVPASSIARSVRAARMEGSKASGVEVARGMTDSNATRDVDHLLNYFGLSLKVPRDVLLFSSRNGDSIELPWIRPSAWVKYLIEKHPTLLSGNKPSLGDELEAFWAYYKKVHPEHVMFAGPESQQAHRMRTTIPLLLHGDEGRYLKRSNFMVCTVECPLGSDDNGSRKSKACSCASDPVLQKYTELLQASSESRPSKTRRIAMAQKTNCKGHSYLSKFLCFGLQCKFYKEFPGLLQKAFAEVAADLTSLAEQGISVSSDRYYASFLGVKGDLKFHVQLGALNRSYFNVGVKYDHAICHLCMAGSPGIPFEEVCDDPLWESSLFQQAPWDEAPPLSSIPHDSRRDMVGSSIMYLALAGKFDDPCSPDEALVGRLMEQREELKMKTQELTKQLEQGGLQGVSSLFSRKAADAGPPMRHGELQRRFNFAA